MMLDRDKLQKILRNHESIDVIDLSGLMDMHVDDLLVDIRDGIMMEYSKLFKKNTFKIPFFKTDRTREFFSSQLVDLGFLCQHVVKDFKEQLKDKHDSLAYQSMYNLWLLNRGY